MEAVFSDQADGAEARCHPANEMRDAGERISRSDVAEPFAERGRFYDRLTPKYSPKFGDAAIKSFRSE